MENGGANPSDLFDLRYKMCCFAAARAFNQRNPVSIQFCCDKWKLSEATGNDLSVTDFVGDSSPERGAKRKTVRQPWLPFQGFERPENSPVDCFQRERAGRPRIAVSR